jgi:hypothetical protein
MSEQGARRINKPIQSSKKKELFLDVVIKGGVVGKKRQVCEFCNTLIAPGMDKLVYHDSRGRHVAALNCFFEQAKMKLCDMFKAGKIRKIGSFTQLKEFCIKAYRNKRIRKKIEWLQPVGNMLDWMGYKYVKAKRRNSEEKTLSVINA